MRLVMSTMNMPEEKRFAYYQDTIRGYFHRVIINRKSARPFEAKISETNIGNLTLSTVLAGGHSSSNLESPQHLKQSVYILQQLNGTTIFRQDDRTVKMDENDIICFDNTRAYSCTCAADDTFEHLLLRIPYDLWNRRFGRSENVTAQVLKSGIGVNSILSNLFHHIQLLPDQVDAISASQLEDATLSLVSAAFSDFVAKRGARRSARRWALSYGAKSFIKNNLHDTQLTSQKVAASLGISESYLKAVFRDEHQTVNKYMWDRRLEKCREDIADPLHSEKSLAEIAANCGFTNFSHFSRKFKEKFETTASDYRKAHIKSG